jgi:hypothetical protein
MQNPGSDAGVFCLEIPTLRIRPALYRKKQAPHNKVGRKYMTKDSIPDDQQEDLEDLALEENWYFGATLWSTDWTTETITNQLAKKNINLSPKFQRRNAWSDKRKCLFIESLFLGLPVPQLILAEDKNKKGSFLVIDGKQRLLALRQFVAKPDDDEFDTLFLKGLQEKGDLNEKNYYLLKEENSEEINTFDNQSIRTVVIRNWKDDKYLHAVFLRINTGSVQLSPQELRQALFPGEFSDFIDDFSTESEPLKSLLGLEEPDFRMRDVELVLRYFAYKKFGSRYRGNFKKFLDDTTADLNRNWEKEEKEIRKLSKEFNEAIDFIREIFGEEGECRKWVGDRYERRINRAVFDIMIFYFSTGPVRSKAKNHKKRIEIAFKKLCDEDSSFLSSIETTTKSQAANWTRFESWCKALNRILSLSLTNPIPPPSK